MKIKLMKVYLLVLVLLLLSGCASFQESETFNLKAVLIKSKSNGICPESLESKAIISKSGFQSRIPVPEHSITLDLWSSKVEEGFIKGEGSGDYITDIDFFLAMPDSYWVGVMSVLATEGRANGICEYRVFGFKDGDKDVKKEILISGAAKRVNKRNISLNNFSALESYFLTNKKMGEKLLGAIDSYSLINSERELIKLKF